MTLFGELNEKGEVVKSRTIDQSALRACPHFILVPEHYREDQTCRCDDPSHCEMEGWGYTWIAEDGEWR